LKYARLYYSGQVGRISFTEPDAPKYTDFAYLSFTIGMTFQVSYTDIQSKEIRRTALRHAWLSFPLGAVIIATSINLVSGLATWQQPSTRSKSGQRRCDAITAARTTSPTSRRK
jgi:uncharacterized membrane protein